MLTRQRKQLILEHLRRHGQVVAKELSTQWELSEDTIRRDLRALAAEGALQRVHGGALPASPAIGNFAARQALQPQGKEAIAATAAAMVMPGQTIFLDGGTTCQQLARQLPATLAATVITHSPTIAIEFIAHPLTRDLTDPDRQLLDGGKRCRLDGVSEAGGKAHGAKHAQLVF